MIPAFVILATDESGGPALLGFADSAEKAEETRELAVHSGWANVTVIPQTEAVYPPS